MTNRLAGETSPYLQQHAENPVDWHPWDEQALTLARRDGKPAKSRMTFFNLGENDVRQLVEQSTDDGKTWTAQIDLHYSRKK